MSPLAIAVFLFVSSVAAFPQWGQQGPMPNYGSPMYPQQYPQQGNNIYQNRGPLVPQQNQNGPFPGERRQFGFDFARMYPNFNHGQQYPSYGGPQQGSQGPAMPNYPGSNNQVPSTQPGTGIQVPSPNMPNFPNIQVPVVQPTFPALVPSSTGADNTPATDGTPAVTSTDPVSSNSAGTPNDQTGSDGSQFVNASTNAL